MTAEPREVAMARAYGERHGCDYVLDSRFGSRRIADGSPAALEALADWIEGDHPFGCERPPRCVMAALLRGDVVLPVERGEVDGG